MQGGVLLAWRDFEILGYKVRTLTTYIAQRRTNRM